MGECDQCGESVSMPFTCKFCGKKFCSDHRLPENHDCGGLESYKADKKREDDVITYDAEREQEVFTAEQEQSLTDKLKDKLPSLDGRQQGLGVRQAGLGPGRQRRRAPLRESIKQSFPEIATFGILAAIVIVFLLEHTITGFMQSFALLPNAMFSEPWRILTSMFMHANEFHLLVNAMVLFFFGAELERRLGTKKFLEIYFVSGVVAALGFGLYGIVLGDPAQMAVGASGALFGVFATLAVIAPQIRVLAFFIIPLKIRQALVMFALIDIFMLTQANIPIASSAHLSGLVAGLVYGYMLKKQGYGQARYDLLSI